MIDAKEVSAAHRARYFWGNLPGMNRLVRQVSQSRDARHMLHRSTYWLIIIKMNMFLYLGGIVVMIDLVSC